ncbi:hypothetical protein NDGK_01864 [Clostridiales bacterium CHKCI001]|nr:hypothetical protein NDGK_01864 [Clostridiales bacterium CHKCI001]
MKEENIREEFVQRVYESVVNENLDSYKDLFQNTEITNTTMNYWKKAIAFYSSFEDGEKSIFFDIIRQIIIDTISSIFGIMDGSSTLSGGDEIDVSVEINGIDTDHDLQDGFLAFVEEIEETYGL